MSNLFLLPDGNALSVTLIRSVRVAQGKRKGVICCDAQNRPVAWIAVPDEKKCLQVRDIMIRVVDDGRRFQQPDWSFLTVSVATD